MKSLMKSLLLWALVPLLLAISACSSAPTNPDDTNSTEPATDQQSDAVTEGDVAPPDNPYPYPAGEAELPAALPRPENFPTFPGKLAFHSDRLGALDIYILDGASGNLTRLNNNINSIASEPIWSTDCQNLFMAVGDGAHFYIGQAAAADGAEIEPFFDLQDVLAWNASPSPTADVIAYQRTGETRVNICFTDSQTNDLGCMQRGAFSNRNPSWLPDGSGFIFSTDRDNNQEIYYSDYPPNGNPTRLTNSIYVPDRNPSVSPDGSRIVFESRRDADFDIFVMNIDGSGEVRITEDELDNLYPDWVGNDQVVWSSNRVNNYELYLTTVGTDERTQLSYNIATDGGPVWCSAQ